jgi:hypothetical protein
VNNVQAKQNRDEIENVNEKPHCNEERPKRKRAKKTTCMCAVFLFTSPNESGNASFHNK